MGAGIPINFNILNQKATPAFYADVFANRPAAGFVGRMFVSTDTFEFYRDNGTTYDIIGGPGAGTITGSGTAGKIAKFTAAGVIADSVITESGGNLTIGAGTFTAATFIGALTGNALTATALQTPRSIGGVTFDGTVNITVATATGGFTVSGGALALGTNTITMTGSLAGSGARVTKGWFTDVESTNMYTVGGTSLSSTFAPITAPVFVTSITTPSIIGGTAVGSNIIYKSTTGVGTSTGIAHQFNGGNNGNVNILTMLNNGFVGLKGTAPGFAFSMTIYDDESAVKTYSGIDGQAGLHFYRLSTGTNPRFLDIVSIASGDGGTAGGSNIRLLTHTTSLTVLPIEVMRLTQTQTVQIGSATPTAGAEKVQITGTVSISSTLLLSGLNASQLVATNGSKILVNVTDLPNGTTATTQAASDNSTKVATTAYADAAASSAVGSTYTPSISNTSNVASSTPRVARYHRIGNQIFVSGIVTVDPTLLGLVSFDISLPVASNFGVTYDASGVAVANDSGLGVPFGSGFIVADPTTDAANLNLYDPDASSKDYYYQFSYTVI